MHVYTNISTYPTTQQNTTTAGRRRPYQQQQQPPLSLFPPGITRRHIPECPPVFLLPSTAPPRLGLSSKQKLVPAINNRSLIHTNTCISSQQPVPHRTSTCISNQQLISHPNPNTCTNRSSSTRSTITRACWPPSSPLPTTRAAGTRALSCFFSR